MTLSDKDVLDADYFNFRRLFAIPLTIPVLLNTFRVIFINSVSTESSYVMIRKSLADKNLA